VGVRDQRDGLVSREQRRAVGVEQGYLERGGQIRELAAPRIYLVAVQDLAPHGTDRVTSATGPHLPGMTPECVDQLRRRVLHVEQFDLSVLDGWRVPTDGRVDERRHERVVARPSVRPEQVGQSDIDEVCTALQSDPSKGFARARLAA